MIISLRHKEKVAIIWKTLGFRSISWIGFHYGEYSYNSVINFAIPVRGYMINVAILIFYIFTSFFLSDSGEKAYKYVLKAHIWNIIYACEKFIRIIQIPSVMILKWVCTLSVNSTLMSSKTNEIV